MIIAQLTDTHIRPKGQLAYGVVDTADFLAKAVAFINALDPEPAALIITGDLVDFGTPEEYAHFIELTAPLRVPVLPLPGNHDNPAEMAAALRPLAPLLPPGGDLSYTAEAGPLRLVMLDSTVPGKPHGLMSPARLDWLDRRLAEAPERPALVALHHPPFHTGIRHMDVQNCFEAEKLAAVLRRHPQVLGVVCGNVHRTVLTQFAGRPASIAPSPAHAVSLTFAPGAPPSFHLEPPGLHLHRWHVNPDQAFGTIVTHLLPIGGFSGPHPFFNASGHVIGSDLPPDA